MLFLDRLSVMSCGYYYPLSEKNANETNAFSDCFYISNSKLEKYVWLCLSMSICVCVTLRTDQSRHRSLRCFQAASYYYVSDLKGEAQRERMHRCTVSTL